MEEKETLSPEIENIIEKRIDEIDEDNFYNTFYDTLNLYQKMYYTLGGVDIDVSHYKSVPANFNVDTTNMPFDLETKHFIIWIEAFNQLLKKIGLPSWNISIRPEASRTELPGQCLKMRKKRVF